MASIKWYAKQLFPFTYWTTFKAEGKPRVAVWRMWFGRCFDCHEWVIEK